MKTKVNGCVNLKVRINDKQHAIGSGFYIRDKILMEMPRSQPGEINFDEDPFYVLTNFHVVGQMKQKINFVREIERKKPYTLLDMRKYGVSIFKIII